MSAEDRNDQADSYPAHMPPVKNICSNENPESPENRDARLGISHTDVIPAVVDILDAKVRKKPPDHLHLKSHEPDHRLFELPIRFRVGIDRRRNFVVPFDVPLIGTVP